MITLNNDIAQGIEFIHRIGNASQIKLLIVDENAAAVDLTGYTVNYTHYRSKDNRTIVKIFSSTIVGNLITILLTTSDNLLERSVWGEIDFVYGGVPKTWFAGIDRVITGEPETSTNNSLTVTVNTGGTVLTAVNTIYTEVDLSNFDDNDFFVKTTVGGVATIVGKSVAEVKALPGINIIDILYANLSTAITNSTLIVGQAYKITDYASVHTIPNTTDTNTAAAEPLIVLAIAPNKLAPKAYSPSFPQDVIYYSPTNDQAMVPGCTKGFIYRRVDTLKSIDIGFDWRSVKFRRWQISVSTQDTDGAQANYTTGAVVLKTSTADIYIKLNDLTAKLFTSTADWKKLEWSNLTYVSPTITNWVINPNISFPCSALYMDYTMFSTAATTSGVQSDYMTIYVVKIAQNSTDILVRSNTVIFGLNFFYNTIGSVFNNNTIGKNFHHNNIGNNFINNFLGYTVSVGATYNNIGFGFSGNLVWSALNYNNIGNDFYNNLLGKTFIYNVIPDSFTGLILLAATLVYALYPKWWFKSPDGTKKLYYFADATFALTVSDVTV